MEQFEAAREVDLTLNARLMWAVFAASGSKKKGGGRWSLKDFLPKRRRNKKLGDPMSAQQMAALATHWNAMLGGRDLRKKGVGNGESR